MLGLLSLFCSTAFAGERFAAWSYGAATVPVGVYEVEAISTVETHREDGVRVSEWEHEVELEYGVTRSLEAGLYLVGAQTDDAAFTFAGYKARLRYRPLPLGAAPVDLAGYIEYIGTPTFDTHGVEAKIIVAHEGMDLKATLNITGEVEWSAGEIEPVLEPTAGVAWRLNKSFAVGAEGKLETVLTNPIEGPYLWLGPTVHLAGKDAAIWWTLSAMAGVTEATRNDAVVEARSLLGIDL